MRGKVLMQDPQTALGNSLIPAAARIHVQGIHLPKNRLEARKLIREKIPRVPGIYGYIDRSKRLIYVGKSKALRHRLLSYQSKNPPDAKMTRIVRQAHALVWEPISHELLALLREQELISRWRPVCNTQGQPQRRQPVFLKLDMNAAPFATHARRVSHDTPHHFFGPIAGSKEVGHAIVSLNYAFRLRDCHAKTPMNYGNQLELFPELRSPMCIRAELGTCTAPCAGGCTQNDYESQAQAALAFLEGKDLNILIQLQENMFEASQKKAFERAAIYRNQFDHLSWLSRRLEMLRKARKDLHGVFPIPGFNHQTVWAILQQGTIQRMVATTETQDSHDQLLHQIQVALMDDQQPVPTSTHEIYMQLILMAWFRKHREDRHRIISFDDLETLEKHLPS